MPKQIGKQLCRRTITTWLDKFTNYCSEICTSGWKRRQWDKERDYTDDDTNPRYDEKRRDRSVFLSNRELWSRW